MSSNNFPRRSKAASRERLWLRVLGIVLLSLLVLGAAALVAYRVGFDQGADLLTSQEGFRPPRFVSPFDNFHQPMYFPGGRGFHPMMRFGWHFFHPGFWLGLVALVLIVFQLVGAFGSQPASTMQTGSRRSTRE